MAFNKRHTEQVRALLRTQQTLHRLQAFFMGETDPHNGKPVELSAQQVKVGLALLDKALPALQSIDSTVTQAQEILTEAQLMQRLDTLTKSLPPETVKALGLDKLQGQGTH